MTNRSTNLLIAAVVLALAGLFWWASSRGAKYDWSERFREEKGQPYDLTIMHRLLENYFPAKKIVNIRSKLTEALPENGARMNYFFIGEGMLLDSADTRQLLVFVRSGGTAFLATKTLPTEITRELLEDGCEDEMDIIPDYVAEEGMGARLNFLDNSLRINDLETFEFSYRNKPASYPWAAIDSAMTCPGEQNQTDLGTLNDSLVNFIEWRFGAGRFLLHTNPVAFCNYFLLKKNGQQYAAGVLSHLTEGEMFWDEKNRTTEDVARRRNQKKGGGTPPTGNSPLAYILKQPALAWAWYLMLGLVGAFVLFRGKRRQRIIPVLPKLENTTLDFVKTIGQLSFRQQNQSQLCQQNMKLFLAFLRERYNLVPAVPDSVFFKQIAQVSQVREAEIELIFALSKKAEVNLADESDMIALYRGIERFYQNCK